MQARSSRNILITIVLSQFCCTSLWFAGNAVVTEIGRQFNAEKTALADLSSMVQFGFICGTLIFALLSVADRFSPSKVFFVCALAGAGMNASILFVQDTFLMVLLLRFATGFFLAGIYPVGMKIAADHFAEKLGRSLGLLVGALVLGTAFPHLLRSVTQSLPWKLVLIITSVLALCGGVFMLALVPNGPYRKAMQKLNFKAIPVIFQQPKLRAAALAYFGHMWELYAFWAFLPVVLQAFFTLHGLHPVDISMLTFMVIAAGGLSCMIGGELAEKWGKQKIAFTFLLLSCCCCVISPLMFYYTPFGFFIAFLLFHGLMITADSPLFSALVATHAPADIKGTALTIINCIGFAITIVSIQLLNRLQYLLPTGYLYLILCIGPVLGLVAFAKGRRMKAIPVQTP